MKIKFQQIFTFLALLLLASCSSDDISNDNSNTPNTEEPKLIVGKPYRGGIIAYIFKSTDPGYINGEVHGLIITENDISVGIKWAPNYDFVYSDKYEIGKGLSNTNLIVTKFGQDENAAKLCYDLSLNSYDDWYLPSYLELEAIKVNKAIIGNLTGIYWSSSEKIFIDVHAGPATAYTAYIVNFTPTSPADNAVFKTSLRKVRAVRNF